MKRIILTMIPIIFLILVGCAPSSPISLNNSSGNITSPTESSYDYTTSTVEDTSSELLLNKTKEIETNIHSSEEEKTNSINQNEITDSIRKNSNLDEKTPSNDTSIDITMLYIVYSKDGSKIEIVDNKGNLIVEKSSIIGASYIPSPKTNIEADQTTNEQYFGISVTSIESDKSYIMDLQGNIILKNTSYSGTTYENLAIFNQNGFYGIYDLQSNYFSISPVYDSISIINSNLFYVTKDSKRFMINSSGEKVKECNDVLEIFTYNYMGTNWISALRQLSEDTYAYNYLNVNTFEWLDIPDIDYEPYSNFFDENAIVTIDDNKTFINEHGEIQSNYKNIVWDNIETNGEYIIFRHDTKIDLLYIPTSEVFYDISINSSEEIKEIYNDRIIVINNEKTRIISFSSKEIASFRSSLDVLFEGDVIIVRNPNDKSFSVYDYNGQLLTQGFNLVCVTPDGKYVNVSDGEYNGLKDFNGDWIYKSKE